MLSFGPCVTRLSQGAAQGALPEVFLLRGLAQHIWGGTHLQMPNKADASVGHLSMRTFKARAEGIKQT